MGFCGNFDVHINKIHVMKGERLLYLFNVSQGLLEQ